MKDVDLPEVERVLRCVVLWGASSIKVELDNKDIIGVRFKFPDGRGGYAVFPVEDQPRSGDLMVARGKS